MHRLLSPAEVYALLIPQLMPAFSQEPINMRDPSCIGVCFKAGAHMPYLSSLFKLISIHRHICCSTTVLSVPWSLRALAGGNVPL